MPIGNARSCNQAIEWMRKKHKFIREGEKMIRLYDDIVTYKDEQEWADLACIECYMKQFGLPEDVVIKEFQRKIENGWKVINEECLRPRTISAQLVAAVLNMVRLTDATYRYDDGYTNSEKNLKDIIIELFIDEITINI
ncbi:hypothetical protein PTKIN_Ptkin01aG0253100 [Pterospermum kingtungense]